MGNWDLLGHNIDVPCPRCGYPVWIQLIEVAVQCSVRCPVCRIRIDLVDERGSVRNVVQDVNLAMAELEKTLRGLSG